MEKSDLNYLREAEKAQCEKLFKSGVQIIIEKPLRDSKKADLVVAILNLLVKEQLSLNQMQELLQLAQCEAFKIPIVGFCSKSD